MNLLKIPEAAARLRLSECSLRRKIARGTIPHHRLGKVFFFTEEDLTAYLTSCAVPAKAVSNG
jgi:excisionase family DNA binding protein